VPYRGRGRQEKLGCWRAEIRWTWRLAGVGWASFLLLLFFLIYASPLFSAIRDTKREGKGFGRFQTGSKHFEKWNLSQKYL
jgi:hypothetical protein